MLAKYSHGNDQLLLDYVFNIILQVQKYTCVCFFKVETVHKISNKLPHDHTTDMHGT